MVTQIIYEIPLFLFVLIAIYVIYSLVKVRSYVNDTELKGIHSWLIYASISFSLWAVDHIFHDLYPFKNITTQLFFHYVISHGFLLISMICIGISAKKTKDVYTHVIEKKRKKK